LLSGAAFAALTSSKPAASQQQQQQQVYILSSSFLSASEGMLGIHSVFFFSQQGFGKQQGSSSSWYTFRPLLFYWFQKER